MTSRSAELGGLGPKQCGEEEGPAGARGRGRTFMLLVVHHLVRRTLPWRLTRIIAWIILSPHTPT